MESTIRLKISFWTDNKTGRKVRRFTPIFHPDITATGELQFAFHECWDDEPDTEEREIRERRANAAFIVRAANNHDDLVTTLTEVLNRLERVDSLLLEATNSPRECPLGEVTRGRAVLEKAQQ